MDISEQTGALLITALVIGVFLFLVSLLRGVFSEKQQTGIWIVFAILFFGICRALLHGA